jgi:hypothetical protein
VEAVPPAAAETVTAALKEELTAQGYGVVGADARGQAQVASKVAGLDGGCLVTLTLTRQPDGLILDEQREPAASQAEVARATRAAMRRLATQIRLTWGVRVKVKSP